MTWGLTVPRSTTELRRNTVVLPYFQVKQIDYSQICLLWQGLSIQKKKGSWTMPKPDD